MLYLVQRADDWSAEAGGDNEHGSRLGHGEGGRGKWRKKEDGGMPGLGGGDPHSAEKSLLLYRLGGRSSRQRLRQLLPPSLSSYFFHQF
jgi:hypothetical protein